METVLRTATEYALHLESSAQSGYVARRPPRFLRHLPIDEMRDEVESSLEDLRQTYADDATRELVEKLRSFGNAVADLNCNALALLNAYNRFWEFYDEQKWTPDHRPTKHSCRITADDDKVYFFVDDSGLVEWIEAQELTLDTRFLASVTRMCQKARENAVHLSRPERIAVDAAFGLLKKGRMPHIPYRSIGTPGFKRKQTLLFVTDPGDGHLKVTCRDEQLLDGVAVHVEHIDRSEGGDRERVEPYRIPAAISVAQVRLVTGPDAPCSVYIGRPVLENRDYDVDRLKTVHTVTSACSLMFLHGVADCKLAIERMTATEAVDFMRAVAGNCIRDRARQCLSAAFNIHTPIIDDRQKPPRDIRDPKAICELAVELTAAGGFNKVTWDGAQSNVFPSVPIIEQLPHSAFTRLVHQAHMKGLNTYMSAGLLPENVESACATGVDGLGIGTSLHYINKEQRRMGDFNPEAIRRALAVRDIACDSPLGRGAALLSRLGWMHFEGTLDHRLDDVRALLLEAVAAKDEHGVNMGIKACESVCDLGEDTEHPHLCQGKRVLLGSTLDILLRARIKPERWDTYVDDLRDLVEKNDMESLATFLSQSLD